MECKANVKFAKATASSGKDACVEVGTPHFRTAKASGEWATCVEVGFGSATEQSGCDQVHVRNSRFPDRVVDVPQSEWARLVRESQTSGRVVLTTWFPTKPYGDFAASFTRREEEAFASGVLANEPQLVGSISSR